MIMFHTFSTVVQEAKENMYTVEQVGEALKAAEKQCKEETDKVLTVFSFTTNVVDVLFFFCLSPDCVVDVLCTVFRACV